MLKNMLRRARAETSLLRRTLQDMISKDYWRFAAHHATGIGPEFIQVVSIDLEMKPGANLANKRQNLKLVRDALHRIVVAPGEVFSFWSLVGRPTKRRGFAESRVIRNGKIDLEVGGGICQASGLVYWLALRLGMNILERHAHTVDLYNEKTRFTPLGSDATVVFGHKDLRFSNCLPSPVVIELDVRGTMLCGRGYSAAATKYDVEFEEGPPACGHKPVKTYRSDGVKREQVADDSYKAGSGVQ